MAQSVDIYRVYMTLPVTEPTQYKEPLANYLNSNGITQAQFFTGWGSANGAYANAMVVTFGTAKGALSDAQALALTNGMTAILGGTALIMSVIRQVADQLN